MVNCRTYALYFHEFSHIWEVHFSCQQHFRHFRSALAALRVIRGVAGLAIIEISHSIPAYVNCNLWLEVIWTKLMHRCSVLHIRMICSIIFLSMKHTGLQSWAPVLFMFWANYILQRLRYSVKKAFSYRSWHDQKETFTIFHWNEASLVVVGFPPIMITMTDNF